MDVRPLVREDVSAATRLSTQAGWNQLPADWHRLLELAPKGCHAGWVDDELVASATVIDYGGRDGRRVGWVGMVLVDEAHRRRGYGTAIFRHALAMARERGVDTLGLDATDAGRAVYRKRDFVDVAPIERWSGSLDRSGSGRIDGIDSTDDDGDVPVDRFSTGELDPVADYDRVASGVDRRDLLSAFLADESTAGLVVPDDGGPRGYALLRPGRVHWHLGPIVATDDDALDALLSAAADRLDGESVIVDPLVTPAITDQLSRYGLERQRQLTRMSYGADRRLLSGESVVAAAGFEWG